MAVCFTLRRKSDGEIAKIHTIDEEICKLLDCEVDPKYYCTKCDWYNSIGFLIALGTELHSEKMDDKIREWCMWEGEFLAEEHTVKVQVLNYLRENFTDNTWTEIGKVS